jgi:hypothetical protein
VLADGDADGAGGAKRYSNTERLLLCKAWVRTSEDPVVGANMTGGDFNKKLHANYIKLLTKQYMNDVLQTSMKTDSYKNGNTKKSKPCQPTLAAVNSVYPFCTTLKVGRYFSKTISYWIHKWQGLWDTLPEESGTTFEDKYRITNQIFGRKYRNRNFDDFKDSWLYLQDIPKFGNYTMKHHKAKYRGERKSSDGEDT